MSLPPHEPSPASGDSNDDTKLDLSPSNEGKGATNAPATPPARTPKAPSDNVEMYDVIEPPPAAPPAPGNVPSVAAHGKSRIEAPGLIDDFDEDADFSEESVLREARQRDAAAKVALDDTVADDDLQAGWEALRPGKDAPQFVQPKGRVTIPGVKAPAIVGGVLLLIAVVLAFVRVDRGEVYAALSVLYLGLMHSITGVGAVIVGTLEAKARFGSFATAWARMLIALSLLLVAINLPLEGSARFLLTPIGACVYALTLYLLFRWTWRSVGIVAAAHFGLAMLLYVGEWLHGAVLSAQMTPGNPG